ncbi:MAG: GNAT family N-acetyltransferase [Pseudonocardiaceae bacterium]|nr:GNAT family N-acetyltransferase [Pseudonocardiaceae bacterium]
MFAIRRAEPAEWPRLADIERAADGMFADVGIVFPPGFMIDEAGPDDPVWVAGKPPVGFAYAAIEVGTIDGEACHLHQLAVHPDHGRSGTGTALLNTVISYATARSMPVTLTTFRDIPWNGPWYAKHGFVEWPPERWGPRIGEIVRDERAAGLHLLGERVVLRLDTVR